MRRMVSCVQRGAIAPLGPLALLLAGPALAGGTGMPWEGPMQQIVESVTGPVVQAGAVIAVAIFGVGIAMSETGSGIRRGLGILLGLSIAFAASTFFLDFFGFAGGMEVG